MTHTIVNQQIANLTNCESEPIHIPGSIQPFGFLLGVQPATLIIDYCSANCIAFLAIDAKEILGKPLANLIAAEAIVRLQQQVFTDDFLPGHPLQLTLNNTVFNVHAGRRGELLLLEFEPKPVAEITIEQLYGQMKRFASGTEQAQTLKALCQMVATETRKITGFDRVMIYIFDKDYNGEVVAESRREDLESFLNLHYPHTDIPPQARQLYMQNLVRLIADVYYEPVPILTLNTFADHKAVDLSHAVLRSVSPIHIEYLKNMEVGASFSISLIHEGRLWGLIACHHSTPKVLPHHTRLAAQLQGHFLTSQIRVQAAKDAYERTTIATAHLQYLQRVLLTSTDFVHEIYKSSQLLQMANATGVLIVQEGQFYKNGILPADGALQHLVKWLSEHTQSGHIETDSIIEVYPKARELGTDAAGILYHSLGASALNCIIWFRPEMAKTINWAGNPEKAILEKANGVRLSPRKSFDVWQQEVRNKSEEWNSAEIAIAASFAYALQKQIHLSMLAREEARYRKLNEQLTEANEELSRINWISTHDLKEPLRKIQMFGSRILESDKDELSEMVANSVNRMRVAANRMQVLIDDILMYSKMNIKDEAAEPVLLNKVIDEVLNELEEEIATGHVKTDIGRLPEIKGIHTQLAQLFRNLLSNAIKFAKKEEPLTITITCELVKQPEIKELKEAAATDFYHLKIQDTGIGFEAIYASRIFDVFQRLHTASEYPGTGIGLAICRKIMVNHDGTITAEGIPGIGATFNLYFPQVD